MIVFRDVTKTYSEDGKKVFAGFSLTVEDGELVFLTGKSGSGKTTLIRMLLKETEPDSGEIILGRHRLCEITPEKIPYYRREIGVVFQDFRLFDDRTVYGNLELVISMTGGRKKDAEQKITNVLSMLGIDRLHRRYPKQLSGGEMQKVCMARALINNPSVLLCDEPTGNLDPEASKEIFRLLELVHRQGITVIIATHDYETAQSLIKGGRRVSLDQDEDNTKVDYSEVSSAFTSSGSSSSEISVREINSLEQ